MALGADYALITASRASVLHSAPSDRRLAPQPMNGGEGQAQVPKLPPIKLAYEEDNLFLSILMYAQAISSVSHGRQFVRERTRPVLSGTGSTEL